MKKTDLSKIDFGSLIVPVIMGVGAFVGAVMDNKKNQKIDELIEKIDNLENNKESEQGLLIFILKEVKQ